MTTPEQLFADARRSDPGRPLVTFYDELTGERAELSATSLGNWIAKTHFLFLDELGLDVGARAYVSLPAHWLEVVVLYGSWFAGAEVVSSPTGADVGFVDAVGVRTATAVAELYALALAPWGRGFEAGTVPAGAADFVAAVRPQADAWASVRPAASPDDPAWDGVSRGELVAAARERAADLKLEPGARLLVGDRAPTSGTAAAAATTDRMRVETLLAPLTVGGSLVLLRHGEATAQDRRIAQERITAVAPA